MPVATDTDFLFLKTQTHLLLQKTDFEKSDTELLKKVLTFHEKNYYELDAPEISDSAYDQLFQALIQLEKIFPETINSDSPTQRVGKNFTQQFSTKLHLVPMLSLQNTYNDNDLLDWDARIAQTLNEPYSFSIEPKYDGASISLVYENNILKRALTRGNGIEGEEMTQNVLQINNIPETIDMAAYGLSQIEVRGEVIMSKKSFQNNNKTALEENKALFVNPRNAASGSLRMKDAQEVKKRNLDAFVYHLSYYQLKKNATKVPFETHSDCIKMLGDLKFPIAEANHFKLVSTIAEVITFCKTFEQQRALLDYDIDGMVIKINELHHQEKLGMTSHHPRWAVAYKFKSFKAESVLEKVEYQIGRTGVISPVAKIKPTAIAGVIVSSISLFNENNIQEKDLRIGDTILIERAGDVIPNILKAFPEKRNGSEQEIIFPTHCPSCKQALSKQGEEAHWRCVNFYCEAQVVERLIYFCSKNAMDIEFLGEAKIRKFFELGFLKTFNDFYHLPFETIKTLEGFGEKTIRNLKLAIEKSKQNPLHLFILSLGIPFVGKATSQTLANAIMHLYDLKNFNEEQLQTLNDVGEKVAKSVIIFFENPINIQLLNDLEKSGLNFIATKNQPTTGTFAGKFFLLTGTLLNRKRADAENEIKKLGGSIAPSVSSKLNYLIVGADAGSKLEKAKKLNNIIILNEKEFEDLLLQHNAS